MLHPRQAVITKRLSGRGVDTKFVLVPNDIELTADGADRREWFCVLPTNLATSVHSPTTQSSSNWKVQLRSSGDNPFSLIGGTGAIWIRAQEKAGTVRLKATHPTLGPQQLEIKIAPAAIRYS